MVCIGVLPLRAWIAHTRAQSWRPGRRQRGEEHRSEARPSEARGERPTPTHGTPARRRGHHNKRPLARVVLCCRCGFRRARPGMQRGPALHSLRLPVSSHRVGRCISTRALRTEWAPRHDSTSPPADRYTHTRTPWLAAHPAGAADRPRTRSPATSLRTLATATAGERVSSATVDGVSLDPPPSPRTRPAEARNKA